MSILEWFNVVKSTAGLSVNLVKTVDTADSMQLFFNESNEEEIIFIRQIASLCFDESLRIPKIFDKRQIPKFQENSQLVWNFVSVRQIRFFMVSKEISKYIGNIFNVGVDASIEYNAAGQFITIPTEKFKHGYFMLNNIS